MKHVSLFTGIGGLDLAAEAAGFETVLQVEREPYALNVLERHWPNVPRITDVREVHNDERWNQPTVISGGFPCQPFSAAGKRRGADDDRYLWPELLRIVEELRPSWVVGENVSGLLSIRDGMEIDDMLASLEARNYTPWILHYPAAGVGAYHKRDRVFIVAHSNGAQRKRGRIPGRIEAQLTNVDGGGDSGSTGQNVADAERERRQGQGQSFDTGNQAQDGERQADKPFNVGQSRIRPTQSRMGGMANGIPTWMDGEPDIPRVATGVKDRAARLKALGNAVVPAQAHPIFAAIAEAERET